MKIVNKFGNLTGWNNSAVNLFGRELEGIDAFKYSDEENIQMEYGAGKYPVGTSSGNYKADASISLYFEENVALLKSLPKGMRIQEIPAFDLPVTYEHDGSIYTDIVRNCRFKSNGRDGKNDQGKMVMEYPLVCSHIDYNV
jgi:hypothetical protein